MSNMYANVTVEIVEQPESKSMRFRYVSEGPTAGSINGVNSTDAEKTYPSIRIRNYDGTARVTVSCVTDEKIPKPHPNSLIGSKCCEMGVYRQDFTTNSTVPTIVKFKRVGIQRPKQQQLKGSLEEREKMLIDPFRTGYDHKKSPKLVDVHRVRLCFEVSLLPDPANPNYVVPLKPVVTDPILDKQKVNTLLYVQEISDNFSLPSGNKKIMIFCSKVDKNDIAIKFYEKNADDKIVWEDWATFKPHNVHKQVAISFKTPKYRVQDIDSPVTVFFRLQTLKKEPTYSNAIEFQYLPDPNYLPNTKKRKIDDSGEWYQQQCQPMLQPQNEMAAKYGTHSSHHGDRQLQPTNNLNGSCNRQLQQTNNSNGSYNQQSQPTNMLNGSCNRQLQPTNNLNGSRNQQLQPTNNLNGSCNQQLQPTNNFIGSCNQQLQPTNMLNGSRNQQLQPTNSLIGSCNQQVQPTNMLNGSSNRHLLPTNMLNGSYNQQLQPTNMLNGYCNQQLQPTNMLNGNCNQQSQPTNNLNSSYNQQLQPTNMLNGSSNRQLQQTNNLNGSCIRQLQPTNNLNSSYNQQLQPTNMLNGSSNRQLQPTNMLNGSYNQQLQPTNLLNGSSNRQLQQTNNLNGSYNQQLQPTNLLNGSSNRQLQQTNNLNGSCIRQLQPTNNLNSSYNQQLQPTNMLNGGYNQQLQPTNMLNGSSNRQLQQTNNQQLQPIGNYPLESGPHSCQQVGPVYAADKIFIQQFCNNTLTLNQQQQQNVPEILPNLSDYCL